MTIELRFSFSDYVAEEFFELSRDSVRKTVPFMIKIKQTPVKGSILAPHQGEVSQPSQAATAYILKKSCG